MMEMVAPCGLFCHVCPVYKAADNPSLRQAVAQRLGIREQQATCRGCRPEKGLPPIMGEPICPTYDCAINHKGVEFCHQCPEFPCLKLAPCADKALELPHNTKIYNLVLLQRRGLEEGLEHAEERWRKYYLGKKPRGGDELT